MTLREIFEAFWTITELTITARSPEGMFLHEWIYGPEVYETLKMKHDQAEGKLTICRQKINAHGDPTRGGSEIGWGAKKKLFPEEILDASVMVMSAHSIQSGHHLSVDIEMQPLTVMTLVKSFDTEDCKTE